MPRVRAFLMSVWEPKDVDPALDLAEAWQGAMPAPTYSMVLHSMILPKVCAGQLAYSILLKVRAGLLLSRPVMLAEAQSWGDDVTSWPCRASFFVESLLPCGTVKATLTTASGCYENQERIIGFSESWDTSRCQAS